MYGLRSSPEAWQDYLTKVLQKLSFVRLKSEPSVFTNSTRDCYVMVYVEDLLVLGDKTTVDSIFEAIQKQVLLKRIGYLEPGKPQQFLGRNIEHFGNYCTPGLQDSYINNTMEETGMTNCNMVTAPGIARYKPTMEEEALLDHEQHKRCRKMLVNFSGSRPDIAYATIIFLGTTVAFGSRARATIAFSSAESELYAICAGVNEGLQQAKPAHSHRLHSRQKHCYTTSRKRTSKTHRPQTPLHTRPRQARHHQNPQHQRTPQQRRFVYQTH